MNRIPAERSDDLIGEEIRQRMERHPYLDASGIEVEVTNGQVALKGEVFERQAIRMAKDVAEGVPGVRNPTNLLRVHPEGSEQERPRE